MKGKIAMEFVTKATNKESGKHILLKFVERDLINKKFKIVVDEDYELSIVYGSRELKTIKLTCICDDPSDIISDKKYLSTKPENPTSEHVLYHANNNIIGQMKPSVHDSYAFDINCILQLVSDTITAFELKSETNLQYKKVIEANGAPYTFEYNLNFTELFNRDGYNYFFKVTTEGLDTYVVRCVKIAGKLMWTTHVFDDSLNRWNEYSIIFPVSNKSSDLAGKPYIVKHDDMPMHVYLAIAEFFMWGVQAPEHIKSKDFTQVIKPNSLNKHEADIEDKVNKKIDDTIRRSRNIMDSIRDR